MTRDRTDGTEPDTAERTVPGTDRRSFLQWSGGALAFGGLLLACEDDDDMMGPPDDDGPVVTLPLQNDTDILKFALFLELLEEDFYVKAVDAGILSGNVLTLATNVRNHESAHVDFLQAALAAEAFTQDDVEFDFGAALANQASFLATAQTLEQTGVNAYLGALPLIQARANRTAAGSIFTVEARHTAAFRAYNGQAEPVPDAFEEGLPPQQIVAAVVATGFVVEGL